MSEVCFGDVLYIKGRIGWQALGKEEYLTSGDYYLVTGVDITEHNRINFNQCYYVSKERYEMDPFIQLKEGDIIVTKDGTIGKIGVIDKLDKPATLNSHLFLIRNLRPDIIDNRYLFYILKSDYFQKFATNNTSGSNIPAFTQANIQKFTIDLPSIDTQSRIASILDSIDSKIRNNISICSELEETAKLLYNYWFVQFDFPNEDGKPYKTAGGQMVWNEDVNRAIPSGWDVEPLCNLFDVTMGSSPIGTSLNDSGDGIEFYQGSSDFGYLYPDVRMFTTKPVRSAKAQDVLMSVRAPVGDMNIALNDCCIGRGLVAIHYKSTLFAWCTLQTYKPFFEVFGANGTTFGALTADDIKKLFVVAPPVKIIDEFINLVDSLEHSIRFSVLENRHLTSLRNFLFPMLMNGQVKVGNNGF